MNDSNKILALILGAILGLGAVATVSRNLRDEEPKNETPTEVGFSDGYIVNSDLSEEDIVAYLRFPAGWESNQFCDYACENNYKSEDFPSDLDDILFVYNSLCSSMFDAHILSDDESVENRNVMNFYCKDDEYNGFARLVVAETCYIPVDNQFVIGATNSQELNDIEWDNNKFTIDCSSNESAFIISAFVAGVSDSRPSFVISKVNDYLGEMTLVKA